MPTQKNYVGSAAATTLASGINSGATSISVTDGATYPSANFNIVIDRGLVGEEKIFVTSRSGNTFTVGTRGDDSTTASAHASGAAVEHCGFAEDFQENNDHINASTNVHGLAGGAAVVGTTTTQTLTNKTLTAPVIADFTNAQHDHGDADDGGAVARTFKGVKVYKSAAQSITSGAGDVLLTWNSEVFDTDAFHDTSSNTGRLTVPAGMGGKYAVSFKTSLGAGTSGTASANVYKNGDNLTFLATDNKAYLSASANLRLAIDTVLDLSAGDYIEVYVAHNAGSARDTGSVWQDTHFGMTYLGA